MPTSDMRYVLAAPRLKTRARTSALLVGLGLLVGLVLLVCFQQVVSQSLLQSELRHAAAAADDHKRYLCGFLPGGAGRDQCLAPLRQTRVSTPSGGFTALVADVQEK